MKTSLKLGAAFIGLMVGVGFASGQEILQFFTSFGYGGIAGGAIATVLLAFLVMNLYQIGSRMGTRSHKEAIEYLCGRHLGRIVDWMLTFFLFGSVVVMLAGAGSSFEQQLGAPHYLGGAVLGVLTIVTVCLGLKRVITTMSLITPVLMVIVGIIAIYALTSVNKPWNDLVNIALSQPQAAGNWLLSSLLYVSYNIAGTAAVLVVIGASVKDVRTASLGGIFGGLGIGTLIIIMSIVMLAKIDIVAGSAIPTLFLSNSLAPWFGNVMLGLLIVKLYCTTVGLSYALAARAEAYGLNFKISVAVSVVIAYFASLFGFVKLVGIVYPLMGYLGSVLIAAIIVGWFRNRRSSNKQLEIV
ncbi:membrane protein [Pseudomonas guariconensis]|uniref:YkvI family membrane protein n=1 Tax=Pseudomonas guariconensis TaxID=1288410 RepID=UPI0036F3FC35